MACGCACSSCYCCKNGASLLLHSYPRAFLTVSFVLPADCSSFCMLTFVFQMPGLLAGNAVLPNFPNIWPYNTDHFLSVELGVKLMMSNKLVVMAKKSKFFVIANGPCPQEELVCWQVRMNNVKKRVAQHKQARKLLADMMYRNTVDMNRHPEKRSETVLYIMFVLF